MERVGVVWCRGRAEVVWCRGGQRWSGVGGG